MGRFLHVSPAKRAHNGHMRTHGQTDAGTEGQTEVSLLWKQDYKKTKVALKATRLKAEAKKSASGVRDTILVVVAILFLLFCVYAFFYLNLRTELDLDVDVD
ncbi:hypothetical protein ACEWY4_024236 [Coilia grayii]|uniref:Triple QxxK/R motif-containing protein n=1 Tax=Coilia grayii TaxID=363190 RepID=A0ABD1IZS8_9TELE